MNLLASASLIIAAVCHASGFLVAQEARVAPPLTWIEYDEDAWHRLDLPQPHLGSGTPTVSGLQVKGRIIAINGALIQGDLGTQVHGWVVLKDQLLTIFLVNLTFGALIPRAEYTNVFGAEVGPVAPGTYEVQVPWVQGRGQSLNLLRVDTVVVH